MTTTRGKADRIRNSAVTLDGGLRILVPAVGSTSRTCARRLLAFSGALGKVDRPKCQARCRRSDFVVPRIRNDPVWRVGPLLRTHGPGGGKFPALFEIPWSALHYNIASAFLPRCSKPARAGRNPAAGLLRGAATKPAQNTVLRR